MPRILTLTMNPAIDVSMSVDHVEPIRKLRCEGGSRDPGGGGINVARVAGRLGADAVAVYPAGGFVGRLLERLVARERVRSVVVPVEGETREDFTVLDESSHEQYRFVLPGAHLSGVEWMRCLDAFAKLGLEPSLVCASGSLPPGVPHDFYARVAEIVSSWGARFVLDTSGAPLREALEEHLFLIKPNLRELQDLTGLSLGDEPSRIDACRRLMADHRVEAIALTLGEQGALLVTASQAWRAPALPIAPVSTVGAGDSFLGAMVWALTSGLSLQEAFRYGVAGGSAALLAPGTELAQADSIRRVLDQVQVETVTGDALAA